MAGRFSIEAVFRAVDRVTAPISRMQNRVSKFTRKMSRGFHKVNRIVKRVGSNLKRMAVVGAASLATMGFAFVNLLRAGADFEQAITNVGAVSLQTRDQIKPLEKLALKLGRTTKFTATQSAQAMEIMARAGFKVNEILDATPAVLSAAAASGLEISEVANVVSNALKGMGLEASEAGKVADILALASSRTNSSIGSLGESLKNVASTARQLNIPIEEVVASIALLQDVGLDASVAGSAFNVMLTKMATPSVGMTKKMKKLGITFKDAKGNMLPLQKVIEQLNIASKKVGGNFDKVAFLAELVGLRGQKAAANLGELFETGKLEKLTEALKNAEGSAKKMADIRMDTVLGSLTLLESAIDAVKVKAFGLQSGPLKDVIDKMIIWVGVNEDLIAGKLGGFLLMVFNNLENIVTVIKQIAIGIASFIALTIALKAIAAVLTIINFLVAANPIVLMIMAAVAAVALLSGALDPVIDMLKSIGGGISAVGKFTGLFGDDDDTEAGKTNVGSQIVSPQDRVARSIEEQRTTSTAEVTIRAGEGATAELTGGKLGNGLALENSGAF